MIIDYSYGISHLKLVQWLDEYHPLLFDLGLQQCKRRSFVLSQQI